MEFEGKFCYLEPFSTVNTVVKAKFETSEISDVFDETLSKNLSKKRLAILKEAGGAPVVVRGQVVSIDEGNQWLRYFLTFLAGKTVFEVEGEVLVNGAKVADLHAVKKRGIGVFGGSSKGLLITNTKAAAKSVASQIVSAIKKS